ncbi:MAG TPA: hypothetical protein DD856_01160 [Sulfobacillus sp.]|jgi:hypothetical protein|nr:hypothetical protein [Sulfobacillus sp.]
MTFLANSPGSKTRCWWAKSVLLSRNRGLDSVASFSSIVANLTENMPCLPFSQVMLIALVPLSMTVGIHCPNPGLRMASEGSMPPNFLLGSVVRVECERLFRCPPAPSEEDLDFRQPGNEDRTALAQVVLEKRRINMSVIGACVSGNLFQFMQSLREGRASRKNIAWVGNNQSKIKIR